MCIFDVLRVSIVMVCIEHPGYSYYDKLPFVMIEHRDSVTQSIIVNDEEVCTTYQLSRK